ncbi:2235_t:CDS:2 [Entrophospora sp. SA101]|nr:6394_t:CDS:2 [Entrophospora candida]CAH1762650.1 2235_t:CDS:2 [Entrophospora sp. SA101]
MYSTNFEHNETAYGYNLRGFQAFVPNAFGSDPDPRFPISPAAIAGAAAFKAVRAFDSKTPYNKNHEQLIHYIRGKAVQETQYLLQRFPLPPDVDPITIIVSAEAAAHRLYDCENIN